MAAEPLANGEWFDFGPDTDAFLARVRSDGLLGALRERTDGRNGPTTRSSATASCMPPG